MTTAHAAPSLRIGQGFDAHRFAAPGSGRELWLAGLRWEGSAAGGEGLDGDSDGDVAAHALIDAVLSACGLGDIGGFFGVGSHSRGAGRHGDEMLREVGDFVRSQGFEIMSASVALVGKRPKLGVRRAEAEKALSGALGCPVTLTATTTDGMGFTGRGEGIAAIATAMANCGE